MTRDQENHMDLNCQVFVGEYCTKYRNGQKEHGGNMWDMGAFQVLQNAVEEILDLWSYIRQILKCLEEIRDLCKSRVEVDTKDILEILERVKKD